VGNEELQQVFEVQDGTKRESVCVAAEELKSLASGGFDSPLVVLVMPGEEARLSIIFAQEEYWQFAMIGREGEDVCAYIGHRGYDRWTRIVDSEVRVISQDEFEERVVERLLFIYLRTRDLPWPRAPPVLEIPERALVPSEQQVARVITPGDVNDGVLSGFLIPSKCRPWSIPLHDDLDQRQLYERVEASSQICGRSLSLWPVVDGVVQPRMLPTDDPLPRPIPPMLLTFAYPDDGDSDFFVYIALYHPVKLRPTLQLLRTLCIAKETTFVAVRRIITGSIVSAEVACTFYIATGLNEAVRVDDEDISLESAGVGRGALLVFQPLSPDDLPAYVVPEYPYRPPADYLGHYNADISFERYNILRQSYISMRVHSSLTSGLVHFPNKISFRDFVEFVGPVTLGRINRVLDTVLIFRPLATRAVAPPPETPIDEALAGIRELEAYVYRNVVPSALADAVRLEVHTKYGGDNRRTALFPARMTVAAFVERAKQMEWIAQERQYIAVQLGLDESYKHVLDGNSRLADVENPIRLDRVDT
jgi:hypothetical protein